MEGLCGNFNGDDSDDFATADGRQTTSHTDIGNSWRLSRSYDGGYV